VSRRVLVVDDDPVVRTLLDALLSRDGWVVETADDGVAALEQIASTEFDVIVSDAQMPRLDGPGLLATLRGDPRTMNLPFVLLSASDDRPASAGATGFAYLKKPISPRTFATQLSAALEEMRR
jgi:CheY-like chemotaxis protein